MWPIQSHMLAPVTRLTSIKRKLKWTQVEEDAFDEIKPIMAGYTLLNYPYFSKTFEIHTDDRTLQLGSVISQKGKPIYFYSIKLTDSRQRYTGT